MSFYIFAFFVQFCSKKNILKAADQFVWSIRFFWYPYCHTLWHLWHMAFVIKCHKMAFYGILWRMSYGIKCNKLCQYGYQKNRIDQTNWSKLCKRFSQDQISNKKQKTEILLFPLYFGAKPFVKCLANSGRLNMLRSNNFWFHLAPLDQMKDSWGVPQWVSNIYVFTAP